MHASIVLFRYFGFEICYTMCDGVKSAVSLIFRLQVLIVYRFGRSLYACNSGYYYWIFLLFLLFLSRIQSKPHIHQFLFCNIDCCSKLYSPSNPIILIHTYNAKTIDQQYLSISLSLFLTLCLSMYCIDCYFNTFLFYITYTRAHTQNIFRLKRKCIYEIHRFIER